MQQEGWNREDLSHRDWIDSGGNIWGSYLGR